MTVAPALRLPPGSADLAAALADRAARDALAAQLPPWLRARRWFGGATRRIVRVEIAGWLPLPDGAALMLIAVVDEDGATSYHPLLLGAAADGTLTDAIDRPALRAYLLERLLAGEALRGCDLTVVGGPLVAGVSVEPEPSRVVGVEQSNTSVIYGDRAIMKLYRRLVTGSNPEVELGRYLTGAGFPAVPRLLATAQLVGPGDFAADLLVLQDFVPNDGDGWAWAVAAAKTALAAADTPDALPARLLEEGSTLASAAELGGTTAQLHATLSAATDPDLRPLPVTAEDRAAWAATLRHEAAATLGALDRAGHADAELRAAVEAAGEVALEAGADGGLQTRVHGDYHLGQVLRGDRGWIILDFEGEPARTLAERRRRQSPLVDLAGMCRSWGYAAQSAAIELGGGAITALAVRWEALVRQHFLRAYWAEASAATAPFLPRGEADRETLLRAFEAQKALYEVRYEIDNRPAWLHIPAGAVKRLASKMG